MKFTVNREKLQKALQKVGSIITARSFSMMPLLGNVLLEAKEDGKLALTTTDLEVRISTSIEAQVEEPGRSTAPARKLASLIGSLDGTEVKFDIDGEDHIKISCSTGRYKLLGLPAADFPENSDFTQVRELKFKSCDLKRMIGAIAYSVSVDDSRKVLTGVMLSCRESMVTMVATDGKRMAMQEKAPESMDGGDGDTIIPLKAINEVRRMLEGDGIVTLRIGEKQCAFSTAEFELATKLIEGQYPNYRQVVPASFKETIELPVGTLLSKLETVSLLLSESSSFVILHFENNKLVLQAASSEVGEANDYIEIAYSGETFDISLNPVFLADPLRNTDMDKISFKVNDPINPVAMETTDGFLYVIMPIRKR